MEGWSLYVDQDVLKCTLNASVEINRPVTNN